MAGPPSAPSSPYRRFFEALADGAFVLDRDSGEVLALNDAVLRMYGVKPGEADPSQAQYMLHPSMLPAGTVVSAAEHARADGTRFLAEARATTVEFDGRRLVMGLVRDVSDRERVAAALRENRRLLELAFDKNPLMMTIGVFPGGELLEVNEAFCQVLGYTREELKGRTSVSMGIIRPEARELFSRELQAYGAVNGIEFDVFTRDGRPLRMRYWAQVIQTTQGPRLYAAAENITERVRSEQARDEALARMQKVAANVPGVMYQFRLHPDGHTDFPYASPSIQGMFGVAPDEVKHDAGAVWARIHAEDLPQVQASVFASAQGLTPWEHEFRATDHLGRVRWVLAKALPEAEGDGVIIWHGFAADVTERRLAEEALRVSEERFRYAIEATADGLWDFDYGRGVYFASNQYFRILGYEPGGFEVKPSIWHEWVHPDDHGPGFDAVSRCLRGEVDRFDVEHRIRAKSGEYRWVFTRGRCLARDPSGKALRLLGTMSDVTEQRRLHAGLAQSDRLSSMGMLAAGVAHEINNPLAYVLSNLESVGQDLPRLVSLARRCAAAVKAKRGAAGLDDVLGDAAPAFAESAGLELLESAQSALEGTRRIRRISRTLGTFTRVDRTGRDDVDVNVALETAATMASNEVRFRATLMKELQPVPAVHASEGKLAQVFLNLLINAAQAIPEGHVGEHCITLRTHADDSHVIVEVIDTGQGIAPQHLERVFEPFFTTRQFGLGSGLGLSISRNIVNDFGGDIRLESELGRGTRVVVRLPRSEAPQPAGAYTPTPSPVPARRGRVLVVDDEAPIQQALMRALGKHHEVITVSSGREAQLLLRRDAGFDLVLCDLMMPEMTGMELHQWLTAELPALAPHVVFLSGGAFTHAASAYLARVGNARLDKPFDQAELKALIARRVAHG